MHNMPTGKNPKKTRRAPLCFLRKYEVCLFRLFLFRVPRCVAVPVLLRLCKLSTQIPGRPSSHWILPSIVVDSGPNAPLIDSRTHCKPVAACVAAAQGTKNGLFSKTGRRKKLRMQTENRGRAQKKNSSALAYISYSW
jgi:hypothetical protein